LIVATINLLPRHPPLGEEISQSRTPGLTAAEGADDVSGDQRGQDVVTLGPDRAVHQLERLPLGKLPGTDPGQELADGHPEGER